MKNRYFSIGLQLLCIALGSSAFSQDQFTTDFEPIHKELVSWDPVRGEWLSGSLVAMSKHEPIPDRYFPEDITPGEMLRTLPDDTKGRLRTASSAGYNRNQQSQQWQRINSAIDRTQCSPVSGRSYGDPHLSSFDGITNSFQTVGEFVLVESASGNMGVHVRQKNTSDEISVTNAIAMNVGGDRVAIYGAETPDGNRTTPLRVNGEAVYLEDDTYYLPNGGTIQSEGKKLSRDTYTVTWPTGETVKVAGSSQMNIVVQVYPCSDSYQGILGNANGNRNDDYNTRGTMNGFGNGPVDFGDSRVSDQMQREYLAYMSKDFAMSWRITQQESLFDYGFNQNTMTYTDYTYPRIHRTVNDMAQNDRDRARRECERAGIPARDMNACIYDVGFARIPPSPAPVVPDRTVGRAYEPVTGRVPNTNPGGTSRVKTEGKGNDATISPVTSPVAQPISEETGNAPDKTSGKTSDKTVDGVSGKEPTVKTPATSDKVVAPDKEVPAAKPVVKPVVKPVEPKDEPVSVPAKETPKVVSKPVETRPYEPPAEPEKPKRTVGNVFNSGSSGSSIPSTTPARSPEPVSTPQPVIRTPSPSKPSTPSPVVAPPRSATPVKSGRG